uniref:Zeta toxin domain-containing protein n=1 Tax=viral metagenome TaxID=1070528 RepID=A0A6C0LE65_9ZZZZ
MILSQNKKELINCIQKIFNFKTSGNLNTVYYINNYDKNKLKFKKLACFDLDHTLIKPKGNRKLPKDEEDYEYLKNVREELVKLQNDDYHIIIFSNQSSSKLQQVIIKVQNILLELLSVNNLKISIFIATKDDYYRKPHTGMFDLFLQLNDLYINDIEQIFYCGDAAGRHGDFACSDYAFSFNLSLKYYNNPNSIKFYVPEEIFLKQKIDYLPICKDKPKLFINDYYKNNYDIVKDIELPTIIRKPEIVVMCGFPGSGKSNLAYNLYGKQDNYIIISKDIYKTRSMSIIKQSLKKNLSVVVDDTNVDIKNREPYINLAKENNISIKCIHVNTPLKLCKHLNDTRVEIGKGSVVKVPDIAYNVLNKKYSKPKLEEGFNKIYIIPFLLPSKENIKLIPKEFYYIYNDL